MVEEEHVSFCASCGEAGHETGSCPKGQDQDVEGTGEGKKEQGHLTAANIEKIVENVKRMYRDVLKESLERMAERDAAANAELSRKQIAFQDRHSPDWRMRAKSQRREEAVEQADHSVTSFLGDLDYAEKVTTGNANDLRLSDEQLEEERQINQESYPGYTPADFAALRAAIEAAHEELKRENQD